MITTPTGKRTLTITNREAVVVTTDAKGNITAGPYHAELTDESGGEFGTPGSLPAGRSRGIAELGRR